MHQACALRQLNGNTRQGAHGLQQHIWLYSHVQEVNAEGPLDALLNATAVGYTYTKVEVLAAAAATKHAACG